jgi:hypothetical protein
VERVYKHNLENGILPYPYSEKLRKIGKKKPF